jgi:hypothetical protein
MKRGHQISENEMVATFVAAEFNSARFGKTTRRIAKEFDVSPSVILNPNLPDGSLQCLYSSVCTFTDTI